MNPKRCDWCLGRSEDAPVFEGDCHDCPQGKRPDQIAFSAAVVVGVVLLSALLGALVGAWVAIGRLL